MTTAAFIILAVALFWLAYSASVWLDLRLEENRRTRSYIEAVRDEC